MCRGQACLTRRPAEPVSATSMHRRRAIPCMRSTHAARWCDDHGCLYDRPCRRGPSAARLAPTQVLRTWSFAARRPGAVPQLAWPGAPQLCRGHACVTRPGQACLTRAGPSGPGHPTVTSRPRHLRPHRYHLGARNPHAVGNGRARPVRGAGLPLGPQGRTCWGRYPSPRDGRTAHRAPGWLAEPVPGCPRGRPATLRSYPITADSLRLVIPVTPPESTTGHHDRYRAARLIDRDSPAVAYAPIPSAGHRR